MRALLLQRLRVSLALSYDAWVNVAILATCVVVTFAVIERRGESIPAPQLPPQPFIVGEQAEVIPGVKYDAGAHVRTTVVLYLRSSCQFCTASMPFYQRLREAAAATAGTRLIAVGPEPTDDLASYLRQHLVEVDAVVSYEGRPKPTPTVLLVDSTGVIRSIWMGQQRDDGERDILEAITQGMSQARTSG